MNGKTTKTVDLTPSWEAALTLCIWSLEQTMGDLRSGHADSAFQHRINILRETFLPLCRTIDERNAEIRKERETAEVMLSADGGVPQSCGHSGMDADFRCCTCGADCSQG